jgi:hypothetical protein
LLAALDRQASAVIPVVVALGDCLSIQQQSLKVHNILLLWVAAAVVQHLGPIVVFQAQVFQQ